MFVGNKVLLKQVIKSLKFLLFALWGSTILLTSVADRAGSGCGEKAAVSINRQ